MPLSSLYSENAQTAYEAARDMLDFHAQLIANIEGIPIEDARLTARAEAEEAYIAALAAGSDAQP